MTARKPDPNPAPPGRSAEPSGGEGGDGGNGEARRGVDLHAIEEKWQDHWEREEVYRFDPEDTTRPVYSLDTPPPYASGALHCGHAVHYTHQDFMARYQRMKGANVFFPLCFDVNGIPIEERVERQMGITRKDIGRQEFIEICSRFADANIENMAKQFRRIGESLDRSVFYRTDGEYYRRLTQLSFIDLFEKGEVYKGEFPVNWCPRCMTAMADAEVEYKAGETRLNFIKFHLVADVPELAGKKNVGVDDDGQYLEIATTRPELLCTCQVVAIHPEDERARHLEGREVQVPIFGKKVRVITDESVDPTFGSGVLMVCTIGDKEDLKKVFKYKLPMEIAIEGDGTLNAFAGAYKGMKIADARAKVIEDLQRAGALVDTRKQEQNVGACWRCKTPVEFVQNPQWFLRLLPHKDAVKKAADSMEWYPAFMKQRLYDWVDSLEWDWVISRQRYFATPVPLWECVKCGHPVLARREDCYVDPTRDAPPVPNCPKCKGTLKGCEDVFDTWMDSSISPLYNAFWNRGEEPLWKRLYPMTVRPQSHDIIRTWAFYTILRCLLLTGKRPFDKVMMGGFILAPDGSPMHKSKGNVVDPLDVIKEHGAEALRYYATTCSLGEDNAVRFKDIVRGQRFAVKFHNIQQFIGRILEKRGGAAKVPDLAKARLTPIDKWVLARYARAVAETTEHLDRFDYAPAMKVLEQFAWHELADHYLELVKTRAYGTGDGATAAAATLKHVGLGVAKLLAPFLPHVTEEAYHQFYKEAAVAAGDDPVSIHRSRWPTVPEIDVAAEVAGEKLKEIVAAVRNLKRMHGMPLNAPIQSLTVKGDIPREAVEAASEDLRGATGANAVHFSATLDDLKQVAKAVKPVHAKVGPTFKRRAKAITEALSTTDPEQAAASLRKGALVVHAEGEAIELGPDFVEVEMGYTLHGHTVDLLHVGDVVVIVDLGKT